MSVRRLLIALLLVTASTAALASAASLGGTSAGSLGAGDTLVARCDDAVNASLNLTGTTITAVSVTDLAVPACVGGALSLVVTANGTEVTRGGPVTVAAATAVVPVAAASGIGATDVRLVIVGP